MLSTSFSHLRTYWLWVATAMLGALVFVAWPGATGSKAQAVLHGLCAQTPSHTFAMGGDPLPFDGRMTGIYGGAIVAFGWLAVRRRLLFFGNPPVRVIVVLALFVGLMAIDGFNSLFHDLRIWHPYEPRNIYRLLTGFGTGVSLAVALSWLMASSMWNVARPEAGVRSLRDVGEILLIGVLYVAIVLSGWGFLSLPLTALLMASAWLVVSVLMLVAILLMFRIDERVRDLRQLHVPGAFAALVALGVMLALAGGRFWAERTFGISVSML